MFLEIGLKVLRLPYNGSVLKKFLRRVGHLFGHMWLFDFYRPFFLEGRALLGLFPFGSLGHDGARCLVLILAFEVQLRLRHGIFQTEGQLV